MRTSKLVLLFLFTTICYSLSAQQTFNWKQATSNGYTYKYVTNDPMKARFYTLKNGLSVILTENHKEPRIAVNIAVRAGSNTDPKDHTGLAHYLEHLLFKGTDTYGTLNWAKEKPYIDSIANLYEKYTTITDPEERKKTYHEIDRLSGEASKYSIANEYDKLMTNLGSQGTNAHTWVEETVYQEDIPSNAIDKFLIIEAERFRNPVFRLFHTELEAVYEEKNRTLDNDGNKVQEVMMYNLFPTNNYGQQTTIGTIEDLKNPSIKAIRNYYNSYYVPNNMSIIMAGDFNADELIKKIDQHFAYMQPKPLHLYNPAPEKPITTSVTKDVFGPAAENMRIAYRTPAANTHDALVLNLISSILYNGSAGLFDINLNKNQKVQGAWSSLQQYKDYGVFSLIASPKEGQTLEELKPLLLGQLDKIKKGDFDESLVKAIVANSKLSLLQGIDNNGRRLNQLMDAFIKNRGEKWDDDVAEIQNMSHVTKSEIEQIANKYFGDNYVLVNKRKGEDKNIVKVEKPAITPVETNAGKVSPFVQKISAMPVSNIKPQWINYETAITKSNAGIADVLYTPNKENDLFHLYYRFDMGSWNDKLLPLAVEYLQFLGTDEFSAEEISKAFYNIACNYYINVTNETTTITISGLQENFDKAVALFEKIIAGCKPNEEALTSLKNRWLKSRANSKLNKTNIARGLMAYAQYGKANPFNNVLGNEELKNIQSSELINELHHLLDYKHTIIYYGPQPVEDFKSKISKEHHLPAKFVPYPKEQKFTFSKQEKNQVLFANYDMVQSEIYWIRNLEPYNFKQEAVIDVFNNYFGSGMGGIVFQTIRESKALAYSTAAFYRIPAKKEDPFSAIAYVGCQADKMNDAVKSMNELLNELPQSEQRFDLAVAAEKKDLQTQRITKDNIIFSYLNEQKKGFDTDMRKVIYENLNNVNLKDITELHQNNLANKFYTYCIVGSDEKIKMDELKKIGDVKTLSLEEIFGY
jgi:predicted Zn-dependent peptidase